MDISGINPSYNYKPRQLTIGHRLERGLAEARVTEIQNSKDPCHLFSSDHLCMICMVPSGEHTKSYGKWP